MSTLRAHANLCVFNRRECVFDHEMHMNTLECSFVVHHQLQSQYRMNTVQFQVSHYILHIHVYLRTHVSIHCSKPMAVHMSGLYSSTAVVVVMQFAHYGVWCLPKAGANINLGVRALKHAVHM